MRNQVSWYRKYDSYWLPIQKDLTIMENGTRSIVPTFGKKNTEESSERKPVLQFKLGDDDSHLQAVSPGNLQLI